MEALRPKAGIAASLIKALPRFRFRLTTLLVGVTAVCAALGIAMHHAQRKKGAVARLEQIGAAVFFDYQKNAHGGFDFDAPLPTSGWARSTLIDDYLQKALCVRVWDVRLTDADVSAITALGDLETLEFYRCDFSSVYCEPLARLGKLKKLIVEQCELGKTDLAPLVRLTSLVQLELNDTDFGEQGLPPLSSLASLETLWLRGASVAPGAMEAIGSLPMLQYLRIDGGALKDDDLAHVANLTSLDRLEILQAGLTERALARLGKLTSLTVLTLRDTYIRGDTGDLEHLHGLTGLRFLELRLVQSRRTDEALKRLRRALPSCQIYCQPHKVGPR